MLTLVLLGFLVTLLTSLAILSRIEGNIVDHALQQSTARQHALLALSIALGRLQKYAGPDTRVTATAAALGGVGGTTHYTGVWDSADTSVAPLTWLVSGNERVAAGITPSSEFHAVELVGAGTSGLPGDVVAPLQAIAANAVPGQGGAATVGHYAWWVGDEGVKASVGVDGRGAALTCPPFDSLELRSRVSQQLALGAGPADLSGHAVFEPRDPANLPLLPRVADFNQLARLKLADGVTPLGGDALRPYFHAWTVNHRAVLANTRTGGLRQDLSLQPDLLGSAFAAWADYGAYMEDPAVPLSPQPAPAYPAEHPAESLRRRYRLTPPRTDSGITHGVAPLLSYFLLTFNLRTDQAVSGAVRPLEVRARWLVSCWNPYSSALVPEELQLEVTGLPTVVVGVSDGTTLPGLSLEELFGAPLRINLPWETTGRDDQQSWLPGRVYTWSARQDLNKHTPVPATGFASAFYTRTLSTAAGQGVQRAVAGTSLANAALVHLQGNQTQLTVRLFRGAGSGARELLRTFSSPVFSAFITTPAPINQATYQFTYVFHLMEGTDLPATPDVWLSTGGQDPRETALPAGSYLPGANGPRPELYANYTSISFPDRLLDRALPGSGASATGQSYNEDAPLFELPRGPLLSLGALQHVHTAGTRPFALGNPWGSSGRWNALFDQYFFSGLNAEVVARGLPAGASLPNSLIDPVTATAAGSLPTLAQVAANSAAGYSSKYWLQGGAFNLNSVQPSAWLAVLRGSRVGGDGDFRFVAAQVSSGTSGAVETAVSAADDLRFYRFPFSAQETYRADAGYAASTTTPPAEPNPSSPANTHLFRRGLRTIAPAATRALAARVVELLRQRQVAAGPFRTLEEFLAPSALFDGRSLLEAALDSTTEDGRPINDPTSVPEFSSQRLTQGDLMTALAPVLLVRSDTFRIRAYGDAVNPATTATTARAWCEAIIQRLPEYREARQDPAIAPGELGATNQAYGRRFVVRTFRWLNQSDI